MKSAVAILSLSIVSSIGLVGCSSDKPATVAPPSTGNTVRLLTYDSFTLPATIWDGFTTETGLKVEVLAKGDTGQMLNTAILTKDEPIADVVWAIDRTFLSRAATSNIFALHQLNGVPVDPSLVSPIGADRIVPVDSGEVCVNADSTALAKSGAAIPKTLDDLAKPEYKGQLVVENPATSAPGLAFLLATVEQFGENGWRAYWEKLMTNNVKVVNGWDEAWNTEFSGAGKGTHSLVVSYATSPVAVVAFGADPLAKSTPVVSLPDTCFSTAEYAGVLDGTGNEANGRKLLAYLLSEKVQSEVAMNMFVFPARTGVALPEPYTRLGVTPSKSSNTTPGRALILTPERIQAQRDVWIDEWTKLVLN